MASVSPNTEPMPAIDSTRRFVRKLGERANGFVEFEFAIGEPEIFVELILGRDEFDEFCRVNAVEMLAPHPADGLPVSDWDWRLSDATATRFK